MIGCGRYPRHVPQPATRRVALVTLGCARNEVDSEELAARLAAGGWSVGTDATGADVVVVNTCGFVAEAKQESIDTLLAAADGGAKVVATGCLAERYGRDLADTPARGRRHPRLRPLPGHRRSGSTRSPPARRSRATPRATAARCCRSRPVQRPAHVKRADVSLPGHAPAHLKVLRQRLDKGPVASLKLASGCDRRCSFCAIPSFRGAFVSRTPDEVLAEAEWLAGTGVRELVLVSENSTSYGKDLGDPRALDKLLPQLAAVRGIVRVRVSYLQPAETRPGLIEAIATTPGVAPYFDLSFQHSSEPVLRRMRRFGSTERFLDLLAAVRALSPEAGARSNVIVGFPGETRADVAELARFLAAARLDAIGVFGYSDEDGTEAAGLAGKVGAATVRRRVRAHHRTGRLAVRAAGRGARRHRGRRAGRRRRSPTRRRGPRRAPGARDRRLHHARRAGRPADLRPGDLVRAKVTAQRRRRPGRRTGGNACPGPAS